MDNPKEARTGKTGKQTAQAVMAGMLILALCGAAAPAANGAPPQAPDKMQTISLVDRQAGNIPFMTMDIPQGWTHDLQTVWNKNNEPNVSIRFNAKEPNGYGTYFSNPTMIFYDIPQINGTQFKFRQVLNPKEAIEYIMGFSAQTNPKIAALNYTITRAEPEQEAPNTKLAVITAEYTEDGIPKHEVIAVSVQVSPDPYATMWSVVVSGCAGKREVPVDTLKQRLAAINNSQKINQQWVATMASVTAQWNAENTQATAAQNRQHMDQFNRNLEHQRKMSASIQETGDYIRNSNNERFQNRMGSMSRVTQMNVDTIQGNYNYTTPGGTLKDNTTHQNIWVNPNNPNERIYINDSTYNPNADPTVNKSPWDKAERR